MKKYTPISAERGLCRGENRSNVPNLGNISTFAERLEQNRSKVTIGWVVFGTWRDTGNWKLIGKMRKSEAAARTAGAAAERIGWTNVSVQALRVPA